jgi:hypothetical protein
VVSALTAFLAILLPTVLAITLLSAVAIIGWWLWRRRQVQRHAGPSM